MIIKINCGESIFFPKKANNFNEITFYYTAYTNDIHDHLRALQFNKLPTMSDQPTQRSEMTHTQSEDSEWAYHLWDNNNRATKKTRDNNI